MVLLSTCSILFDITNLMSLILGREYLKLRSCGRLSIAEPHKGQAVVPTLAQDEGGRALPEPDIIL